MKLYARIRYSEIVYFVQQRKKKRATSHGNRFFHIPTEVNSTTFYWKIAFLVPLFAFYFKLNCKYIQIVVALFFGFGFQHWWHRLCILTFESK